MLPQFVVKGHTYALLVSVALKPDGQDAGLHRENVTNKKNIIHSECKQTCASGKAPELN